MKRGVHTNKVEIFETCDFDSGMIERKVFINDKFTYEEKVTAIIDRQSADKGSQLKQFVDWLIGIEHKPEIIPPANVKTKSTSLRKLLFGNKRKG